MTEQCDLFSHDFLEAYLLGGLTEEQVHVLDARLREDPQACQQFVRAIKIMSLVREEFQGQQEQGAVQAGEPMLQDFDRLFAELLQAEHEAQPVALATEETNSAKNVKVDDLGSLSAHDLAAVGGYVLRKALTSKAAVYAYAAAIVLLAVVLINPWSNETPTDTPFATDNPNMPDASTELTPRGSNVATLTAQRDAQWSSDELTIGDALVSGQRLILTHGFAEITTARGAVAVLQAPATVELINNNALHLHTGRLVGKCYTESSKGFAVHTAYAEITDIGTEFGVEVIGNDQATSVQVMSGEVHVKAGTDNQPATALKARQAIKIKQGQIDAVAFDETRFARDVRHADLRPRFEGARALWLGGVPADLRIGEHTSESLQVFLEQAGLMLNKPVPVDVLPTTAWPPKQFASHMVREGQRVDVYLLHFDTPTAELSRGNIHTLHFDRPILGVIGAHSSLRMTDASLGGQGVAYPVPLARMNEKQHLGIGLDYPEGDGYVDQCEILNDGRSLKLNLNTGSNIDQVRILVASELTSSGPLQPVQKEGLE